MFASIMNNFSEHVPIIETRPETADDDMESEITSYRSSQESHIMHMCDSIEIILLSNWGHDCLIGLTGKSFPNIFLSIKINVIKMFIIGLEIFDKNDKLVEIQNNQASSINESVECKQLFNGINLTVDPNDMWLTNYTFGKLLTIKMNFEKQEIKGIAQKMEST